MAREPVAGTDAGDEDADAQVFLQHEAAIRRYCLARFKNPEDADDAVVDTLTRFLGRKDRDIRNPEAWLIRAARYSCLNVIQRRDRRAAHEVTESATGDELTPDLPDPAALDPEDASSQTNCSGNCWTSCRHASAK